MVDPAGDRPDPCDKSSAVAFGIAIELLQDRPDPCDKSRISGACSG